MRGKWTIPGDPLPSAHLIALPGDVAVTRCGRTFVRGATPTDEPPARGKTCESCLRLSRRDG